MAKTTAQVTRELPQLSLRATVVPETLDEEKRTVEVVWTTGARVLRGFFHKYYEELSLDPAHVRMGRLQDGAPFLDSHRGLETRGVVGVVEQAALEDKRGIAKVRFAKDDTTADAIFKKIQDGILRKISVGYAIHRLEKIEETDDGVPVYRATDWEPMELSVVPIAGDAGAHIRADGARTNPCEFVLERDNMLKKANTKTPTPATPATSGAPDRAGGGDSDARAQGAAAEQERITVIQRTAGALVLDAEFTRGHIRDNTGVDEFRALAFDEYEKRRPPHVSDDARPTVHPGEDERDKWLRGASNWIIQRANVGAVVRRSAKQRGETIDLDPGEFRGLRLLDLARMSLDRAGVKHRGLDVMELVGRAFQSTSDFPVLLQNTLHRVLLAQYAITPDTWTRFCRRGSVGDFRPHNRYRMGTFGPLDKVNEHGEFKTKTLSDGRREQIVADTAGNIVSITRKSIINDDMGAFSDIATMLGRAAALSIDKDIYGLLAENGGLGPVMVDGDTLFHANHANLGAGAALSVASLDADRVIMGEQTDESGKEVLDLRPSILIVPLGLGGEARVLNEAQYDVDGVAAGQMHARKPNKVAGLFEDIVDTARLTDATRRYEFADPSVAPTLEVAFLDGMEEPFLEVQNTFDIDGVKYKVRLDYATGAIDYRGAVTNAGV